MADVMLRAKISQTGSVGCNSVSKGFMFDNVYSRRNIFLSGDDHQLTVSFASNESEKLMSFHNNVIYVSNESIFNLNDRIIIGDCFHGIYSEAVEINHINNDQQEIVLGNSLANKFKVGSTFAFHIEKYHIYVRKKKGHYLGDLVIEDNHGNQKSLANYIENIDFQYIIQSNQEFKILKWFEIENWNEVNAISINIIYMDKGSLKSWHTDVSI